MEFHLLLEGFRSFQEEKRVLIRPVTVLVGENSSGKSSILAAIRYLIDWIGGDSEASFNSEPFFLGSFHDIAHYRGGRAGRKSAFTIGLEFFQQDKKSSRRDKIGVRLTFDKKNEGVIDQVTLIKNDEKLSISSKNGRLFFSSNIDDTKIDPEIAERMPPFEFIGRSLRGVEQIRFYIGLPRAAREEIPDQYRKIHDFLLSVTRALKQCLPSSIFASGAVRTEPQRSYDPTKSVVRNDPNAEIYRMAVALRQSQDSREIKESIIEFGRRSKLFSDFEMKSLGRSASDPFQIFVNASGRKFNIADIGYGVSQILPIAFRVQQLRSGSMYLLQQPEVHLHPSAQAEFSTWLISRVAEVPHIWICIETHSDFIIDRLLQSIASKKIRADQAAINWINVANFESSVTNLKISDGGEVNNPPKGYRQFFLDEARRNLGV